jgi:aspartyl/asparaginyl-tRNA synthetase
MQVAEEQVGAREGAEMGENTTNCGKACGSSNLFLTPYSSPLLSDSKEYNYVVKKLREFFLARDFIEVSTQNRLSILAACEDPFNVACFDYAGSKWPLPQTGQMWLEYELLKNPNIAGYFCLTTSYRMEKNPVEGRHDIIFPLFEFEMKGGMEALIKMEEDLLAHLGYDAGKFMRGRYTDIAKEMGTVELEHEHETRLYTEKSPTYFITDFPEFTDPFWNMKRARAREGEGEGEVDAVGDGTAKKVDVILSGQETIGSAEREDSKEEMLKRFKTIMGGDYSEKLYELFGVERTDAEMKDYLDFDFFERCGGGIGVTRLIRSMRLEGLLNDC